MRNDSIFSQVPAELNPPIQYNIIWLLIGLTLVACIVGWYVYIYRVTRKRPYTGIEDLDLLDGNQLEDLKTKYLALVEAAYNRYMRGEITLRELHYSLSMAVREFAGKASHFPAMNLTLTELKYSSYHQLSSLIEEFYPSEFASIEHGDAPRAVQAAKGVISQWLS